MQFRLPDVGEGITESVLLKWHVNPGQSITEDDTLCTIETDKAVVEIPAPCTGKVISLAAKEGATVAVGSVIAEVEPEAGASETEPPGRPQESAIAAEGAERQASASTASPQERISPVAHPRAAPSTRRYASEVGVDLANVTATGPRGRILRSDVSAAMASSVEQGAKPAGAEKENAAERLVSDRVPMSGLRRAVAQNMQRSVSIIPHATSSFRCDAGAFVELRSRLEQRFGQRVSYTAMVTKILVRAVQAYPYFNASIDDEAQEIVLHRSCHIGFATATADGLIVPVIRDADRKSLLDVSAEIEKLAALARERRIPLSDLRGATITLSNVGSHGGHDAGGRPIVNHPQVAIIAMGRIRPEPAVHNGAVCARPTLNFTTSYDHRLIDGAYAAEFMERVIEIIENPGLLLGFVP